MSKFHRRFEPLEPRFLLSCAGLADGSLAAVSAQVASPPATAPRAACSSPAAEPEELSLAKVEDRAEEFLSPTGSNTRSLNPVVAIEPAVLHDTTPTSNVTQQLVNDRVSISKPQKEVAVKTAPKPVAIATSDDVRSLDNQEPCSLKESDATAEVLKDRKPTATDTSSAGSELLDAQKAWSAVAQDADTSGNTASPNTAGNDLDAKLYAQAPAEADRPPAAPKAQAAVDTSSAAAPQRNSIRADQENPFAKAADCVFSEEQPESGARWAASHTLPPAEGALLVVALGKPLSRLAAGDGRVDVASVDCGLPDGRTTFGRSRRNRRKTEEARDRLSRRGDTRELTWLPPEKLPTEISHETTDSSQGQAEDSRPATEPIPSRLADLAVFSRLDIAKPEDRCKPSESWLPALPSSADWASSADWDGYAVLGGAAAATLTGTISVLAIDRHRRIHDQQRRVKLPTPAYTGRTLARV